MNTAWFTAGLIAATVACGAAEDEGPAPRGRLTALSVPDDAAAARKAGCFVHGSNVGTGIANLILLAGGFQQFLESRGGPIPVVLLAEVHGWGEDEVELAFLEGSQKSRDTFIVDEGAYEADGTPRIRYGGLSMEAGGWTEGRSPKFNLPVPLFEDLLLEADVLQTSLTAQLAVDDAGLTADATLTGYLTEVQLRRVVTDTLTACATDEPPSVCQLLFSQYGMMPDPEEIYGVVLGLVRGLDARVTDGVASECTDDCNAMSVCFSMTIEPIGAE